MGSLAAEGREILGLFGQAVVAQARQAVEEVEIRSAILPTITIDLRQSPSRPAGGGGGTAKTSLGKQAMKIIRPVIEVRTSVGPVKLSPAGEARKPGYLYPVVLGSAVVVAALAVIGVASIAGHGVRAALPLGVAAGAGYAVYRWQAKKMGVVRELSILG